MSSPIGEIIETLGYTTWYINRKTDELEKLLEKRANTQNLIISMDVQGPITRLVDADFWPWWGIKTALHFLKTHIKKDIPFVINSGWDLSTLLNFREKRLGDPSIYLIGENGAVYFKNDDIKEVNPIDEEILHKMLRSVIEEAAEENLKIAFQGNYSSRVGCIYVEGDPPEKGGILNHFLVKGTDVSTKDIYNTLRESGGRFEFDGEYILFGTDSILHFYDVMRKRYPLQSIRMRWKDGKLAFKRDRKTNDSFTLDDMADFFEKSVPKDWRIDLNPDYNADLVYIGDDKFPTKETTAEILGKEIFGDDDFVVTHIGDKPSDVFKGDNSVFFAQYGTPAQEYCEKNDIPHIPIISGVDYLLTITNYLKRGD